MEVIDLCDISRDDSENAIIDIDGISAIPGVAKAKPLASASSVVYLVESDDEQNNNPSLRRKRKRPRPEARVSSSLDVKPAAKFRVSDEIEVCQVKEALKTPLNRVHEVIPDVDLVHAQKLLFEQRDNVEMVLSILVEKGYPKSKDPGSVAAGSLSLTLKSNLNSNPKLDFFSKSSFEPSAEYLQQASNVLEFEFPFIRHDSINSWLKDHKGHYSLVRRQIENALSGKEENKASSEEVEYKQYLLISEAKANKLSSPRQTRRIGAKHVLQQPRRNRKSPNISEPILQEEIRSYNLRYKEWVDTILVRRQRSEARKKSQVTGTALECSCCFDQVAIEEMVACMDEGHLFCIDCIKGYAENQIFGNGSLGTNHVTKKPSSALLCCHSSGCQSQFQDDHLLKALPKKTLEKYNELQFRAVMEQAGLIQSLCTCPKCGFQADVPETQMIFQCPIEGCKFASCRKCRKPPHIPLKCDEVVKQKREDEGRLKIEEAISSAKIRTCPKCHTSFVKSDGCNKMTCRCGLKMCYICRQPLPNHDPYSHFCNTPHCKHQSCGKCTLYSNDKEDDARAMREAGIDAAEEYREKLLQEDDKVEINLDVDKILGPKTAPTPNKQKRR
ncbi:unnamed protein product [Cylindrotheca closterium]|uniref:RING-type domain-containing protein n=1 Tax=Cylindrotheca closterium TaxID=2856 RepID=A0AAD2FUT8_9STRA|nr:unnamed protein product [Cylindrotheca closterium]